MAASQRVLHRNLQAVLTASGRPDSALEESMARLVTMQSNFEEGLKALEQFVYRIDERLAEQGQFSPQGTSRTSAMLAHGCRMASPAAWALLISVFSLCVAIFGLARSLPALG